MYKRWGGPQRAAVETCGVVQVSAAVLQGLRSIARYYRLISPSNNFVLDHVINPVHHRTLFIIAPAERGLELSRARVRETPPDELCVLHVSGMTQEGVPAPRLARHAAWHSARALLPEFGH